MPRPSRQQRGYGREHEELRAALLAALVPGSPCYRCGEPMWPDSQDIDLGHTEDRSGYRGLEHARCNRAAGGRKAAANRARRTEPHSREW